MRKPSLFRRKAEINEVINQMAKNNADLDEIDCCYIETFVVYSPLVRRKRMQRFDAILGAGLEALDDHIDPNLIFLDEAAALEYGRYMGSSHGILRVYLPEVAIEGTYENLSLRRGFLHASQVHGCFPGWGKGAVYHSNPQFNTKLLKRQRPQAIEEKVN